MKPAAGLMINANVRLLEPLGSGAMGAVWMAEHLTLHTRVAVKVISERLDPDDDEVLTRFSREATTAAQIKSSHVVQTFDHGVTEDGTPFIVMELLDGEGLGDRLRREGQLPLELCALVVLQASKALHSAHKLGIVHRDIKPDNIFLSRRDDELQVKIFDFGIAKQTLLPAMGGITSEDMMVGTPEYMSPEQVMSSKKVDHSADLWALAVVAYACLTGDLPFRGEAIGELCVKLLKGDFIPPTIVRPGLPITVDRFFQRALARQKSERFASAREFAQTFLAAMPNESLPFDALVSGRYAALEDDSFPRSADGDSTSTPAPMTNALAGAPTLAGSTTESPRPRRRSPLVWAAGSFIALAAFGGTLVTLLGRGGPDAAPSAAALATPESVRVAPSASAVAPPAPPAPSPAASALASASASSIVRVPKPRHVQHPPAPAKTVVVPPATPTRKSIGF